MTPREFVAKCKKVVDEVPPEKWAAAQHFTFQGTPAEHAKEREGCVIQRAMGWGPNEFLGWRFVGINNDQIHALTIASDRQSREEVLAILNEIAR